MSALLADAIEELRREEYERHARAVEAIEDLALQASSTLLALGKLPTPAMPRATETVRNIAEWARERGIYIDAGAPGSTAAEDAEDYNTGEVDPGDSDTPEPEPAPAAADPPEAPPAPGSDEPSTSAVTPLPVDSATAAVRALEEAGERANVSTVAAQMGYPLNPSGNLGHADRREVREALELLEETGRIRQVGSYRGGPVYSAAEPSANGGIDPGTDAAPDEEEGASIDPGAPSEPGGSIGEALAEAGRQAHRAQQQARERKARHEEDADDLNAQIRREIGEVLRPGEETTLHALHERLGLADRGLSRHAFSQRARTSLGLETYGTDEAGKTKCRRPLSFEQAGVTVSNGGEPPLAAALEKIQQAAITVPVLAELLGVKPAIAAQAVSLLQREGKITKQPGGKYQAVGA